MPSFPCPYILAVSTIACSFKFTNHFLILQVGVLLVFGCTFLESKLSLQIIKLTSSRYINNVPNFGVPRQVSFLQLPTQAWIPLYHYINRHVVESPLSTSVVRQHNVLSLFTACYSFYSLGFGFRTSFERN